MQDRKRARELAAEYLLKGDPTGWFEALYREGEEGKSVVPWADLRPSLHLLDWWKAHSFEAKGKLALVIGCGLGDDAEQLAEWGFETTAFDIAETAIRAARKRHDGSHVTYEVADLLNPPHVWLQHFDFVFETNTVQALPVSIRSSAIRSIASFVGPGGTLLAIVRGREPHEAEGDLPWPLTREQMNEFLSAGLRQENFEEFFDNEEPPARRFRVLYCRP